MKILLVLWVVAYAECEKLDRKYLPPPSSSSAGGYPGNLDLPLEFSTKNYPSTLEPEIDITTASGSLSSKYPNIALGIDRQGPSMTMSSEPLTNRPRVPVSTIYNIPSTTDTYDFTQASSLSPVRITDTTVGPLATASQEYSSKSSSLNPNLGYDQYLIQQNISPSTSPQSVPISVSRNFLSKPSDIGQSSTGILSDNSNVDAGNVQQIQPNPAQPNGIHVNSQGFYNRISTGYPSTLSPGQLLVEVSATETGTPSSNNNNFGARDMNFQLQREQTEGDRNAVILNYKNKLTPEGFEYSFDTSNGIHVDESGTANNGVKAIGSYSFIGDDGKVYNVEYTADENGFLPRGEHLPTAPPIPEAILKGIEISERNKKLGIVDDGSYDDSKYGHARYQGLMNRIPQNQYNDFIDTQPNTEENKQQSKENSFENVDLPLKKGKDLDIDKYENSEIFNSSTKSKMLEIYKLNSKVVKGDKAFPEFNSVNEPIRNTFLSSEVTNVNNKSNNRPIYKSDGDFIKNASRVDQVLAMNALTSSKMFDPIIINSQKENERYHSGYEYKQPQNIFNESAKNRFPSLFSNRRSDPSYDVYDEKNTYKTSTTQNVSFNLKNKTPDTKLQLSGKTFNDPVTVFGNNNSIKNLNGNYGITQPDYTLFYHRELGEINNNGNVIPQKLFSTVNPNYASTTLRPYNYQSPYTSNSDQRNNFPSSTVESQYSISTTPLLSEISSFTPTTPTTSGVSSTSRPSITSGRPTLEITSGLPDYSRTLTGFEDVNGIKTSTTKPIIFGEYIIGRPGYQGKPSRVPVSQVGISRDLKPRFDGPTKPRPQNLEFPSQPDKFRSQTSTEKVIGEDFSGPKQAQRFDSEYGYYY